jgi:hypothetical protein
MSKLKINGNALEIHTVFKSEIEAAFPKYYGLMFTLDEPDVVVDFTHESGFGPDFFKLVQIAHFGAQTNGKKVRLRITEDLKDAAGKSGLGKLCEVEIAEPTPKPGANKGGSGIGDPVAFVDMIADVVREAVAGHLGAPGGNASRSGGGSTTSRHPAPPKPGDHAEYDDSPERKEIERKRFLAQMASGDRLNQEAMEKAEAEREATLAKRQAALGAKIAADSGDDDVRGLNVQMGKKDDHDAAKANKAPGKLTKYKQLREKMAKSAENAGKPRITRVDSGEEFEVTDGGITIGRDPECTMVINATGIAKKHAKIVAKDGAVTIEDLGSGFGTYVDGKKISAPARLSETSKIGVGVSPSNPKGIELRFRT